VLSLPHRHFSLSLFLLLSLVALFLDRKRPARLVETEL
jgi:hypothetical protein